MQRYIMDGRFPEYHGEGVNPRHLSVWEQYVMGWGKQYDPHMVRGACRTCCTSMLYYCAACMLSLESTCMPIERRHKFLPSDVLHHRTESSASVPLCDACTVPQDQHRFLAELQHMSSLPEGARLSAHRSMSRLSRVDQASFLRAVQGAGSVT